LHAIDEIGRGCQLIPSCAITTPYLNTAQQCAEIVHLEFCGIKCVLRINGLDAATNQKEDN
jgi:hypothetical protein